MNNLTEQCKADFRNFLFVIWKHLGLPPPTDIQNEVAQWLQEGPNRKVLTGFRGMGKSWITSAYVLWRLLCDPQYKVLVVSASKSRADDFSIFTKRLIKEVPMLQHMAPREGQRDSMISFDVGPAQAAHAPSVKSVGVFGMLTGSRATEIIADDIETPNTSLTQDMREKLEKRATEFEAIIVPGGRITVLGTPQSEESIIDKFADKGYEVRYWPSRVPFPDKLAAYKGRLAPSIQERADRGEHGEPTDPKRFTDRELKERELSYGKTGFALQFQLDTSLSDALKFPLKLSDLIVTDLHPEKAPISIAYGSSHDQVISGIPNIGFTGDRYHRPLFIDKDWAPYESSLMVVDPSGRGADETAYAVVKMLHGVLYLMDAGGFAGGYTDETLHALAKIAFKHKINLCLCESNYGGGMFTKIFQPILQQHHRCRIEEVRASGQKELRIIDSLEPVLNSHKLVVDTSLLKRDIEEEKPAYSLFYQLTRLTRDRGCLRHDDRLDALAFAIAYYTDSVARSADKAADEWRERQIEEEYERFMNAALGVRGAGMPKKPAWNNLWGKGQKSR